MSTSSTGMTSRTALATETKRLNVNLPVAVYDELSTLAAQHGRTMTDLVRMAFGLVKVALEAVRDKKSIYVGTDGKIERELIIMP